VCIVHQNGVLSVVKNAKKKNAAAINGREYWILESVLLPKKQLTWPTDLFKLPFKSFPQGLKGAI